MNTHFITSLPPEAENKDFRVIADEGGYGDSMSDLMFTLSATPRGQIEVTAQRDYDKLLLRVYVNMDVISFDGVVMRLDGAIAEFLDFDHQETGNFVEVMLSINPSISQVGQTVGVLRMKRISALPKAI